MNTGDVGQLYAVQDAPFVFATVDDTTSTTGYDADGVYVIHFGEEISCARLLHTYNPKCESEDRGSACDPFRPSRLTVLEESENTYALLVSGKNALKTSYPAVYRGSITLDSTTFNHSTVPDVAWEITFDFFRNDNTGNSLTSAGDTWWNYLSKYPEWQSEYTDPYFGNKEFSALEVAPQNPSVIYAGMSSVPRTEASVPLHTYISYDAGKTWKINWYTENMPYKLVTHIAHSPDGEKLYFLGTCTSMYTMRAPY